MGLRRALLAVLATLAIGLPGGYLLGGAFGRPASAVTDSGLAPCRSGRPAAAPCDLGPAGSAGASLPAAGRSAGATPRPSGGTKHTTRPAHSPSPKRSPKPTPSATSSTGSGGGAVARVLAVINRARASAGLPPYTLLDGLGTSASRHNQLMASGCGLSHQCPDEASLGERETAAGVRWTAAGENIGEGGPVAGSTAAITAMAVGLTTAMLNEKPPNDGHRLNILSSAFTHIGIAIYRDSHGTVWMTQDFAG